MSVLNPMSPLADPEEQANASDSSYNSEEDWELHINGARQDDLEKQDDIGSEAPYQKLDGFLADDIEEEV